VPASGKRIVFVLGGARSGKSSFALSEAAGRGGRKAFIATAAASDPEMLARIERHRKDRGSGWHTREEPINLTAVLKELSGNYEVIVVDCLTLWLANLLCSGADIESETDAFVSSLPAVQSALYIVSNEVGLGIVPDNALARNFRDLAGFLNQKVAASADSVYLMTAGLPTKIK